MSETKFTAGPWEACDRGDYADDGIVILGDERRIAVVYQEEDAALTATAPELYEALSALFADYKQLADSGDAGNWSLEDLDVGKQAMSALSKARGEA